MLLVSVLGVAGVTAALEVGEPAPDFTLPSTTGSSRLEPIPGEATSAP